MLRLKSIIKFILLCFIVFKGSVYIVMKYDNFTNDYVKTSSLCKVVTEDKTLMPYKEYVNSNKKLLLAGNGKYKGESEKWNYTINANTAVVSYAAEKFSGKFRYKIDNVKINPVKCNIFHIGHTIWGFMLSFILYIIYTILSGSIAFKRKNKDNGSN